MQIQINSLSKKMLLAKPKTQKVKSISIHSNINK